MRTAPSRSVVIVFGGKTLVERVLGGRRLLSLRATLLADSATSLCQQGTKANLKRWTRYSFF